MKDQDVSGGSIQALPKHILIGLIIATLGIVSPIVWDLYKARNSLEVQILSEIALIQTVGDLDDLQILFRGQPVKHVTRLDLVLINTGRTPIIDTSVYQAPRIRFSPDVTVLDAKLEETRPPNSDAEVRKSADQREISIGFRLLNPSDFIRFSVLTTGGISSIQADTRIMGLPGLSVIDRRKQPENRPAAKRWGVYIVGAFGLVCFALVVGGFQSLSENRKLIRLHAQGNLLPKEGETVPTYERFVNERLTNFTTQELEPLRKMLQTAGPDSPLSSEGYLAFRSQVENLLLEVTRKRKIVFVIFMCLIIVAATYVVSAFRFS